MSELKEYVVTVKSKSDVDSFYDDMESQNGNDYIPKRKVEVAQLREISRNTHYYLTDEEAENLKNDSRVLSVQLLPSALGFKTRQLWTEYALFNKSSSVGSDNKNWGLYRMFRGIQPFAWGSSTTTYWNGVPYGTSTATYETVTTTSSGKNVDVIVVDEIINPAHPEFAVNDDGTGGSRVVQYDWFQHSSSLGISTTGSYQYNFVGNHGTYVASIVAGNTQGWARDANIYNINFNFTESNKPSGDWTLYIYDYIRAFHLNKPINPKTGRRNPTIVNNSWGFYVAYLIDTVTSVTYRNTTTDLTGKTNDEKKIILEQQCGIAVPQTYNNTGIPVLQHGISYPGLAADITDAINDGIIMVGAAGNYYMKDCKSGDADYNNNLIVDRGVDGIATYYPCRGTSPSADSNVISVGAVGPTRWEFKASFSDYGSRTDLYAPGFNITGAVSNSLAGIEFNTTLANDPRDSNYRIITLSGTSGACAQVTGILGCLLEQWPFLTQSEARQYLIDNSKYNQIRDPGTMYANISEAPSPYLSLGESGVNSNNRFAYYKKERNLNGNMCKSTYKPRPTNNKCYPRQLIRNWG